MSRKPVHKVPDHISASEVSRAIDEYCLDEQVRVILKRRFLDNVKFEDLAYEFGMSVTGIKKLVYKYGDYVFLHL